MTVNTIYCENLDQFEMKYCLIMGVPTCIQTINRFRPNRRSVQGNLFHCHTHKNASVVVTCLKEIWQVGRCNVFIDLFLCFAWTLYN